MRTDFKKEDVMNRRQKERPLQLGIHDISLARYFTISEQSFRYALKSQTFSMDYVVYVYDAMSESRECIGYASPDRNKIVIRVHRHGLDWATKIALSDIHIYGSKRRDE